MRQCLLLATGGLVLLACGCMPKPWRPAPPRGRTWAYDASGTYSTVTAFSSGRIGGVRYGLLFHHSGYKDAPVIRHPDRFWLRQTVAGYRFNGHLREKGDRVAAGDDGPMVGPNQAPQSPLTQEPAPAPPKSKGGDR